MKNPKLAISLLGFLLVLSALWSVLQWRAGSRLRQENLDLKRQLADFRSGAEKVERGAQSELKTARAEDAVREQERIENEHRELLRLRNDISRLRQEAAQPKVPKATEQPGPALDVAQLRGRVLANNEKAHQFAEGALAGASLGIAIRAASDVPDLNLQQGVNVTQISGTGPSKNRLEIGDTILGLDGLVITGVEQFKQLIGTKPNGSPVVLDVYRGKERLSVEVTPRDLAAPTTPANP